MTFLLLYLVHTYDNAALLVGETQRNTTYIELHKLAFITPLAPLFLTFFVCSLSSLHLNSQMILLFFSLSCKLPLRTNSKGLAISYLSLQFLTFYIPILLSSPIRSSPLHSSPLHSSPNLSSPFLYTPIHSSPKLALTNVYCINCCCVSQFPVRRSNRHTSLFMAPPLCVCLSATL